MIKRLINILALSVIYFTITANLVYSQNIPDRSNPPRLVNDFAGLLTSEGINSLERKLVSFNDSTTT
jgi:uncharacterized protein